MLAITPPMWLIYDMAGSQKQQVKHQRHSHTHFLVVSERNGEI